MEKMSPPAIPPVPSGVTVKVIKSTLPTTLTIRPIAEAKITYAMLYMNTYEVSWFGVIEKKPNEFVLTDVLFPPQENQSAFTTTKDDEFPVWFFENITKKDLNFQIRLHGHSHPRMSPHPSGTDLQQFLDLSKEIPDFMIQLIMSNIADPYCVVWDMITKEQIKLTLNWQMSKSIENNLAKVTHKIIPVYNPPRSYKGYGNDYDYYGDFYENRYGKYNKKTKTKYQKEEIQNGLNKAYRILRSDIRHHPDTPYWIGGNRQQFSPSTDPSGNAEPDPL